MISAEQTFIGRVKQAFTIVISNINITIYYILFAIISVSIISLIGSYIFLLASKFVNLKGETGIDTNSYINMGYFGIIYFIISISVLILKIPFYISLVKNINYTYNGVEFDKNVNLKYGFSKIWKIFNTYWYIFKYVALIPSLLLIVGLLVVFFDYIVGLIIVAFSIIIFIYFAIYRGLRSFASLMYAVSYDDYSEDNFKKSLDLTKNKVGTIFWNYVGLAIIFWIIGYLVSKGFNFIYQDNNSFSTIISDIVKNKDNGIYIQEKLNTLVTQMNQTSPSMIMGFIKKLLSITMNNILSVFGVIFYFLLMKKFENDKNNI